MRATTLATLLAAALVAGTATAGSDPTAREDNGILVLTNGAVTVRFDPDDPTLKVSPAADAAASWEIRFDRVVEFRDADADGLADPDEVRAFLDLAGADGWTVETTTEDGRAEVRLGLEAPLTLQGPAGVTLPVPGDRLTANVSLVFQAFDATRTLDAENASLDIDLTEVQATFRVESWSWIDGANDRLALLASVPSDLSLDGLGASVLDGEAALGGVEWMTTAEATTGGETETVDVETEIVSDDGQASLQHAFAASGFDALEHHATLGAVPRSVEEVVPDGVLAGKVRNVPGAGGVLAAVATAGAALALARRR